MTPSVFISYSSFDRELALLLSQRLKEAGIANWVDKINLNLGDNFKSRISDALRHATDLVLIVSPGSEKSQWVAFELGQAHALGCRIIPLLTHPGQGIPKFLESLEHTTSVDRIVDDLKQKLKLAQIPKSVSVKSSNGGENVKLHPTPKLQNLLALAPPEWFAGNVAIDGAFELYSFGDHKNRYAGCTDRNKIRVINRGDEWSYVAQSTLEASRLSVLGQGLKDWIGDRQRKPNRLQYLIEPPKQPVLDNDEFILKLGNSDYFTMRAIYEASRCSPGATDGGPISRAFDSWWGEGGKRFEPRVLPHHISALGVVILCDSESGNKYLVLTLPRADRNALIPGWNATFAEQMWGKSASSADRAWWKPFVPEAKIEPPASRTGDPHIWDTIYRGAQEELGIERHDISDGPRLVMSCLEQDMFFIGFIFTMEVSLTRREFTERCQSSPDREIGAVALYPIDGRDNTGAPYDPSLQLSRLLSEDEFDGGPYLLSASSSPLVRGWHLSSRLRIYAAARHLLGNDFLEHVQTGALFADA